MFIEYKDSVNIHVHPPIPPDDIVVFASQFNIGLTTENAYPLNRDICLTNKTFIYLRAGLAIAASDTKAQSALLNKYLSIGKVYQKDDPWSLANTLLYYDKHREELFETQKAAFAIANEELNWENESKKFLKLVEQTLNNN